MPRAARQPAMTLGWRQAQLQPSACINQQAWNWSAGVCRQLPEFVEILPTARRAALLFLEGYVLQQREWCSRRSAHTFLLNRSGSSSGATVLSTARACTRSCQICASRWGPQSRRPTGRRRFLTVYATLVWQLSWFTRQKPLAKFWLDRFSGRSSCSLAGATLFGSICHVFRK